MSSIPSEKGTRWVPSAVFTDLDGTFLALDKTIPEANLRLAAELEHRGIPLVLATGRPISGIFEPILAIPGVRYLVYSNGAGIWDVEAEGPGARLKEGQLVPGARIHSAPLCKDAFKEFYEVAAPLPVTIDLFADGFAYSERRRAELLEGFHLEPNLLRQIRRSRTYVDEPLDRLVESVACPERLSVYYGSEADRAAVFAALTADPRLVTTSSELTNIEASDPAATKGRALLWLCDRLGADPTRTIAFGDGMNDTLMFETAGLGVAPANAQPGVAERSDVVLDGTSSQGAVGAYLEGLLG